MTSLEKFVASLLALDANGKGTGTFSIVSLSTEMGYTPRTVRKALRGLREKKILVIGGTRRQRTFQFRGSLVPHKKG
jgi:hypothetical protein